MVGQFQLLGFTFPWLMVTGLVAFLTTLALGRVFSQKGFYQYVWHPPLFNTALYFILLGIFVTLFSFMRT